MVSIWTFLHGSERVRPSPASAAGEATKLGTVVILDDVDAVSATSRPPVGVPIHEVALHNALDRQFSRLFAPGGGRSAFVLSEPELGFGRPDAILMSVSPSSLDAFRRRGLRLPSLSAAKSLAGAGTNLTEKHARTLARDLARNGWTEQALRDAGGLIADSLAVEAKLAEWRRAIRQAAGYRIGAGRSAVLLPARIRSLVDERNLNSHGVGLMVEDRGRIQWSVAAPRAEISVSHRAWLLELLIRGLESGTAHRAT